MAFDKAKPVAAPATIRANAAQANIAGDNFMSWHPFRRVFEGLYRSEAVHKC
jgi:hypothetical protein